MKTAIKVVFDYAAAASLLLCLFWIFPIIYLAVRLDSPGPVFFRQERVGRDQKVFECIKFRSMKVGTPNVSTHEVKGDSLTSFGRVLRRTKLDEIPQIFNVLRGDMSLIGPRPCLVSQADIIAERAKRGVFSVKPGIAGLAQVYGVDMSTPEKVSRYDALYIKKSSLCLDVKIGLSILIGRGFGDRVSG